MTVTIKGRNRHSDEVLTTVTIIDRYNKPVLVIEGGYIENRGPIGGFVIAAKHPTAVDDEGDSSYVAMIEGAGLTWTDMLTNTHHFTGALLTAQYITDGEAQQRIANDDPWFTPPTQGTWRPGAYEIRIEHLYPEGDKS